MTKCTIYDLAPSVIWLVWIVRHGLSQVLVKMTIRLFFYAFDALKPGVVRISFNFTRN